VWPSVFLHDVGTPEYLLSQGMDFAAQYPAHTLPCQCFGCVLAGAAGRIRCELDGVALHDRVVVKRLELKEQVRGGIIIPDTAKEKPQEAEVVAVGPGKINDDGKRSPMDVKAGDRILIGKYSGSEIKIDDDEYVIVREDEILAVVEN